MKTKFFLLGALFLLSLCCLSGCSDDESLDGPDSDVIWDIYPFGITITVSDAEGNDLLNPDAENSIAHQGIKMIYQGKTYKKDSLANEIPPSRAYLPRFYGLNSYKGNDGRYRLAIGEFFGDRDYEPQDILLDWNDGTPRDTITFSHRFWWEDDEPRGEETFLLNGKEMGLPIPIVK